MPVTCSCRPGFCNCQPGVLDKRSATTKRSDCDSAHKRKPDDVNGNDEDNLSKRQALNFSPPKDKMTVNGDGHCLFRALAIAFDEGLRCGARNKSGLLSNKDARKQEFAAQQELRDEVVAFYERNDDEFSEMYASDAFDHCAGDDKKSFDDYKESMSNQAYGGELELLAISRIEKVKITWHNTVQKCSRTVENGALSADARTIHLEYIPNANDRLSHYNLYTTNLVMEGSKAVDLVSDDDDESADEPEEDAVMSFSQSYTKYYKNEVRARAHTWQEIW